MHRIDSNGATADKKFTEGNPQTQTPATVVSADWLNDVQENLCKAIEQLGFALSKGDSMQLTKTICGLGTPAGVVIDSAIERTVDDFFPAVPLWDGDHDLDAANYPILVPLLRAHKAKAWNGSAFVTSFSVNVSGSVITLSGTAGTNLVNALAEEVLVHGGYTGGRCVTIGGIEYPVTLVSTGSLQITVSGSPASGAQTMEVYLNRIAAQPSKARTFKDSGRALMSMDGVKLMPGLRRRNYMQGHWHVNQGHSGAGGAGNYKTFWASGVPQGSDASSIQNPTADMNNGTPRTGPDTEPNSMPVYRYLWAQIVK